MSKCSIFLVAAQCLLLRPEGLLAEPPASDRPKSSVVLPAAWQSPVPGQAQAQSGVQLSSWWKLFGDSVLDSLIEQTISGNPDLKIAQERLVEARAVRRSVAAGRQLPTANVTGLYDSHSLNSSSNPSANSGGGRSASGVSLFQIGFDASYELDLFGGARASVRAAEAEKLSTEEAMRWTLVSVVAETTRGYLDLRLAQARASVARRNLEALEHSLRMTEARRAAGLTSNLDPMRAKAQASAYRAAIPQLEAQAQRSIHSIAVLTGKQPQQVQADLSKAIDIPRARAEVLAGLPSDLLLRRPDIRQAERDIAANSARVRVAVSNLFPKFTLTGNTGEQSTTLINVVSGVSRIWSYGWSVSWGILNLPLTRANINAAKSREKQALLRYEKTVLTALREVEDALYTLDSEKRRLADLEAAVSASAEAVRLSNIRYNRGLSSYLDVLDAQRTLYSAEDALVQGRSATGVALASLYKALGGGW